MDLHFILCLERTGSSMLSSMLNASEKVISPSEEPFLLYLSKEYGGINEWTDEVIDALVDDVFLLHDKNVKIYMHPKQVVKDALKTDRPTSYLDACKKVYLQFYPEKDKTEIATIADKQIKYSHHGNELVQLCPSSKFVLLVRNPLDNLSSWRKRKMGSSQNAMYLAEVWRDHYEDLWKFHRQHPSKTLILKYEDLVRQPDTYLKKVCAFLNIEFKTELIEFQHNFKDFSEKSRARDPEFIDRLDDFHSGLKEAVNTSNVEIYNQFFDPEEQEQIRSHCNITATKYGYNLNPKQRKFSYKDWWWVLKARRSRRYILKLYRWIPIGMKRRLRKRKGKYVDA